MKPQQILDLEKVLGFELQEGKTINHILVNSYRINEDSKVIGLHINCVNEFNILALSGFIEIEFLKIRFNRVVCINTTTLKNMTKLRTISITATKNIDISFIEYVTNLSFLRLELYGEVKIGAIKNLRHLQTLQLSNNNISDISALLNLPNLQRLELNNNNISDISTLSNLSNLQELQLSGNNISDISALSNLSNLQALYLDNNNILDISALSDLPNLQTLQLSGNNISDISALSNLSNLQALYLDNNNIKDVLPLSNLVKLQNLPNNRKLRKVSLNYNKITVYPLNCLKSLSTNILHNPLQHPPMTVVNKGRLAIQKYFEDIDKSAIIDDKMKEINDNTVHSLYQSLMEDTVKGLKHLYEAKLILIGNGEVGKSSVRTKLMDRNAPLPKQSTHGIDTFDWSIKILKTTEGNKTQEIDFQLNVWDFGGQGEYRAIQQFFCTRNSLYLYITSCDDEEINSNDEYVGFDYWYPFVQAYGFDAEKESSSPLLHIRNKKDVGIVPLNEAEYREKYTAIYPEFLQVSCTNLENIDRLEDIIKQVLPTISSDILTRQYPTNWLNVKTELEIMRRKTVNYITYQEYKDICIDKGLDTESAEILLRELDTIGTVIYFANIKNLANLVIIDPEWLKEAAYRVLKRQNIRKHYGEFKDFSEVWKGGAYPKEMHKQLEDLMLAFEICYKGKDEHNKPTYFVPSLFPLRTEEEKNTFNEIIEDNELDGFLYHFVIEYNDYMPAGLLHRMMVRHNKETQNRYKWRNCAILYTKNTYAEIIEYWKERKIEFKIIGKNPQYLYRFIYNAIKQMGKELVETKYINPLKYDIRAFYEGDFENFKSLRKMPEARVLFYFLFDNNKPVRPQESNQDSLFIFKTSLSNSLKSQNDIANILTQINNSNYYYSKTLYKDIENGMSPLSQSLQAQNLVNSTKTLINTLNIKK